MSGHYLKKRQNDVLVSTRRNQSPRHCAWGCKTARPTWNRMVGPQKLNRELPFHPATHFWENPQNRWEWRPNRCLDACVRCSIFPSSQRADARRFLGDGEHTKWGPSTPRAIIHLAGGCGGLTSQHCRRLWTWGPGTGEAVRISRRRKIQMEVKIESMDETCPEARDPCLLQQRVIWDAPLGLPLGQVSSGDDGFSCSTLLVFRRVRSRWNSPDTPSECKHRRQW